MSPRIHVGGLPSSTTDTRLRLLRAPHGRVTSACVIRSKITGQPFRYGCVEMGSADEAAGSKLSVLSEGKLVRAELNEDNMVVDIYPTH